MPIGYNSAILIPHILRNFQGEKMLKLHSILLGAALCASLAFADRTITDQLGRKVTIPDQVNRIVVLHHEALNVLNEINAQDKVVGILKSWEQRLGKEYNRLAPSFKNLPNPGDIKDVNYEALLSLKPDAVVVVNYFPKEYIAKMEELKIPVVGISFFSSAQEEKAKLNPTFKDERDSFAAYDEGFYEGVKILGELSNHEKDAAELINFVKKSQADLNAKFSNFIVDKRPRVYMANPDLTTYGSGKYTGVMLARAGATNVAAADIKGYKQVSPEQILAWNPQIILVQNRYPQVPAELKANPALKGLSAVKEDRIYLMPEFVKAWGHPTAEAMALGEEWLAMKLYPQNFKDANFDKKVEEFYEKFYRVKYQK